MTFKSIFGEKAILSIDVPIVEQDYHNIELYYRYGNKKVRSIEFMDNGVGYGILQLGSLKNVIKILNWV